MKKAFITITCLVIVVVSVIFGVVIASMKTNDIQYDAMMHDFVPHETTKGQNVIVEKTFAISVTDEEREMLAKLVFLESSICSADCQRAIASVVFNRLDSGKWRKDMNNDGKITLYDIIYYPNAFTPVLYGKMDDCKPNQAAYDAVDYVLENGVTVPTYVRYFRTDYDFSWDGYENYTIIDNVYFGYFANWQQGAW